MVPLPRLPLTVRLPVLTLIGVAASDPPKAMVVGVAAPFHRTPPAPLPKRTSVMLAPPNIAPLRLVLETLLVSTARLPRKLLKSPLRLAAAPLSSSARYEPAGPVTAPLN